METKLIIQSTPNPNALKFVLNQQVKTEGKVTYKGADDCKDNVIAQKLFAIPNATEIFFFDNYITVTQDGNGDWDPLSRSSEVSPASSHSSLARSGPFAPHSSSRKLACFAGERSAARSKSVSSRSLSSGESGALTRLPFPCPRASCSARLLRSANRFRSCALKATGAPQSP